MSTPSNSVSTRNHPRESLIGHLQRGNLEQILAWDIWLPHRPLDRLGRSRFLDPLFDPVSQEIHAALTVDPSCFAGYLDAFFRRVHVLNPVLDEKQMRGQLNHLLLTGMGWDASCCLLLLVLANGACSSTFALTPTVGSSSVDHDQAWAHARALYEAADKRKDAVWRSSHLMQARCYFYSGVFMMASMRPCDAWRQFLQGLATCQFLMKPAYQSVSHDVGAAEKQAVESIYWSCWKSERELRFELDLPDFPSAGLYDHPSSFPTIPQAADVDQLREWYFYLAEISLWRFEMMARRSMTEVIEHDSIDIEALAERVHDLETSLASWHASLPQEIRFDKTADNDASDLLLYVLRGRLTYSYEVLTWPFLEHQLLVTEDNGPLAVAFFTRSLQIHCERLSVNRPGFYYRHHGTWLMQRSSTRSALALLAVARGTSADSLPAEWMELVSDTINMLEFWSEGYDNHLTGFMKLILDEVKQANNEM